jgi:hypothetical protein
MTQDEINEILRLHHRWLRGEEDGQRADLRGANLRGATAIDAGQGSRGFRFVAIPHDTAVMVLAGCRWLPLHDAWAHWQGRHADNQALRAECLAKLMQIETVAKARDWTLGYDPARGNE